MTNSTQHRFNVLLQGYVKQSLADGELTEFFELLRKPENQAMLGEAFEHDLQQDHFKSLSHEAQVKDAFEKLLAKFPSKPALVKSIHLRRIAIAASVLLVIGLGSYFLFFNKPGSRVDIVKTDLAKDVEAPKGTKAMITLANGQKILLDSLTSGTLATQGNVKVLKSTDGEIVYNGTSTSVDIPDIQYNTLFNPRGSKVVNLTLQDGTKVWLNSESSLRYPIAFAGNERNVEITGEAYFEVVKDPTKKFIVTGNGVITEVLGTHFNVNTYPDENNIKVTLLEGSVKVTKGASTGLLKPGQQAQIKPEVKVVSGVNVETTIAWKNGLFSFDRADIRTVMRQIGRWYDVEVVYKGIVTDDVFGGDIQRGLPLSKVLDFLQKSQVHFVLEGRKLTVMP